MTALAHIAEAAWALRYVLAFLAAGTWFALALCRAAGEQERQAERDFAMLRHPAGGRFVRPEDARWSA